jgi:hypothetical protein
MLWGIVRCCLLEQSGLSDVRQAKTISFTEVGCLKKMVYAPALGYREVEFAVQGRIQSRDQPNFSLDDMLIGHRQSKVQLLCRGHQGLSARVDQVDTYSAAWHYERTDPSILKHVTSGVHSIESDLIISMP